MKFTVISANGPVGTELVNVQMQAPKTDDGTEGSLSLNVPVAQAGKYVVGTVYEVTFSPAKS